MLAIIAFLAGYYFHVPDLYNLAGLVLLLLQLIRMFHSPEHRLSGAIVLALGAAISLHFGGTWYGGMYWGALLYSFTGDHGNFVTW